LEDERSIGLRADWLHCWGTDTPNIAMKKNRSRSRSRSRSRKERIDPEETFGKDEKLSDQGTPAPGWIRCFDDAHNQHYYYHLESGESRWDPPDEFLDSFKIKKEEGTNQDATFSTSTKPSEEKSPKGAKNNSLEIEANASSKRAESVTGKFPSPQATPTYTKDGVPSAVQQNMKRLFYFHILCCEGPATFFETLLRSPGYFIGGLAIFLSGLFTCNQELHTLGCRWLREALLFFASAATLFLPCTVLFVYRDYRINEDWMLCALPTFVGWVDPRRFYVLCRGQGDVATNAMLFDIDEESMDTFGKTILHPAHVVSIERLPAKRIPMHTPAFCHSSSPERR